ncbi:DUF4380 domain-containing protein [Luteimonas saliphila]|uniref:DUF4380 domain-containing protein n=1 Tax=Luteimonas saliphila TaxID=2804919 RepID=UPI00192DC867|nr:DUF4380 domain-containing protein [Luteimonas saliphila]
MGLRLPVAGLLAASLLAPAFVVAGVGRVQLDDGHLQVEIAPALGGRIVHVSLPGRPNLLKVGAAVDAVPDPVPAADGENIPYMGHELWTGPQSGWWLDQDVNPQRRAAAAQWPPDPWLANARNRIVERAADRLVLEGMPSPVSGLRATQAFRLSGQSPATLELSAEAVNVRDREVRRDLWFNTRLPAGSRVFVPVATPGDARLRADETEAYAGPVAWWEDGLYSLQLDPPPQGKTGRRGKIFIAPSAGWIAGFNAGQLLLIRFGRQPDEAIDPEHGQVELYLDWHHGDPDAGLLELEVHAPMRTLAPAESMHAGETWTVLPYDGPDGIEAQRAALVQALAALDIDGWQSPRKSPPE